MATNFYLSGNDVHDRVIRALYIGCPEEKRLIDGFRYEPADKAVVFGVYKSRVPVSWPRGEVIKQHREAGVDVVVLETGYINRGDGYDNHYAAGLNGLNGRADFRNDDSPSDRWEKLGVELKPWRTEGRHLLLCGQVPQDASVDHIDIQEWLLHISGLFTKPVIYRPHPLGPQDMLSNCKPSRGSLDDDLKDCWAVITFNSNVAVEAIIKGVPAFAFDEGSMAWDVANQIQNPPDRTQWAHNLAYTQWTPDEMRSGETWKHLFR